MLVAGFDIGGTKSEVVVLDYQKGQYVILSRKRIATLREDAYEQILNRLANLLIEALSSCSIEVSQLEAIGIGMPGTIDPQSGVMLNGNSLVFVGHNISCDLADKLNYQRKIYCDNDANCFTYAEAKLGAGAQCTKAWEQQSAIGIILGTGCGGGILLNGQLVRGVHGGAGEIGHTVLHERGYACYCGQKGCAEQYLSGPAISAHFQMRSGKSGVSTPQVFELYEKHDPLAVAVINDYLQDLALFIGELTNIFAPDYFILGGGVSNQQLIYDYFADFEPPNLFIKGFPVTVYKNSLGDSAGVIGAAILAADRKEN